MTCLHVKNDSLTASSVRFMVKAKWNNMENINFRNNKIGNDILNQITEGEWPKLSKLDLSYNEISLTSEIMRRINWKSLRYISL